MSFGARFGQLVKRRRGIEGMSLKDLAIAAFDDEGRKSNLSDLENGKIKNPQAKTVDALVVALNIPAEELSACYDPTGGNDDTEKPVSSLFLLPSVPDHFVGRADQERDLVAALKKGGSRAIVGIRGMGGIGKTVLAARVAGELAEAFPDARFAIDLKGVSEKPMTPEEAMAEVLLRFRPDQKLPDDPARLKQLYQAQLSSKKALILLDNARDAAQVMPLLPQPPSAAIVTARAALELPGVQTSRLDVLERPAAIELLRGLLPKEASAEELDALADCCRDHPLALTVAGTALAAHWDDYAATADYIAEIEADRARLKLDGQPDYDLMAVLGRSLTLLQARDPSLVEHWRDLTVFVGEFGPAEAAAILYVEDARLVLRQLADAGFLEHSEARGRYRFHDLMRDLARHSTAPGRFEAAETRHIQFFTVRLGAAKDLYKSGGDGVMAGLALWDANVADIRAAQRRATTRLGRSGGDERFCYDLADAGVYVVDLRLPTRECIAWWQAALTSARAAGDPAREGNALGNLGSAWVALGEPRKAIDYFEQVLAIARETNDRYSEGNALGSLGLALQMLGEPRKAIDYHEQRIEIAREIGDRRGEGNALGNLGGAWGDLGERKKAINYVEQQLTIIREIGDRAGEGKGLNNMAVALARLGEIDRAIAVATEALRIKEEIEDPNIDNTRRLLAHLREMKSGG